MITKREVVRLVLEGKRPPYVPWSMGFTIEARAKLEQHYGTDDVEVPLENHFVKLGSDIGFFEDLGGDPAHDVEGDVPLENMLAMIETVQGQSGYQRSR